MKKVMIDVRANTIVTSPFNAMVEGSFVRYFFAHWLAYHNAMGQNALWSHKQTSLIFSLHQKIKRVKWIKLVTLLSQVYVGPNVTLEIIWPQCIVPAKRQIHTICQYTIAQTEMELFFTPNEWTLYALRINPLFLVL